MARKKESQFLNWCRVRGHEPSCNCVYPRPNELVAMRGAKPGTLPMPKRDGSY